MRLLLDTHILLSLLDEGDIDLPSELATVLRDDKSSLFVSVASLWEIAIKSRSGKLNLKIELVQMQAACVALGVTLLAIHAEHVLAVVIPEPPTRDPFDRLLLAQAQCEDLRLVTFDRALVDHPLAWRATSSGNPS